MENITMNTLFANENDVKPEENYLLQINRIKLIDYINSGLILPDKYLDDECEKDIQSKNKDFLVVCDGYINELDEYQILLELIFTNEDIQKLRKQEDIYYFDFPLPIARIKKVYVKNQETKKHIQVQIQNSENGFLPKELFDVYMKNKKPKFIQKQYSLLDENIKATNYEKQIRYFDKRMGMFSFMKNNELYYSDETHSISNYSKNYFGILSKSLTNQIGDKYLNQLDILNDNEAFKNLLYSNEQIDKEFIKNEAEKIENTEFKEMFLMILKPIGTRDVLSQLLQNNHLEYYLIGLVYYFRQKNANKKDSIKQDIKNLIPYDVSEVSLAILGIYFGYSGLRASEKIEIQDTNFKKIFGEDFDIKFTLESKLDYITIETIYNICFHGKEQKGYEYEYLPYPSKKKQALKTISNRDFKIWYKSDTNQYFDVENITIKKLTSFEVFTNLLGKYSEEVVKNRQTRYLIPFVQYNFGDLLTFNDKGQEYFKKDELLKKIDTISNEKINNELIDVLNIRKR